MRLLRLVLACLLLPVVADARTRSGVLVPEVAETYDAANDVVVPLTPTTYHLHRGRKRYRVKPDRRLLPGATLRVRGTVDPVDGALVPQLDERGVRVLKLPPQTPAFPEERLLVLLVEYPRAPHAPEHTAASIAAQFEHLAVRVAESSYGRTHVTVTMTEWALAAEQPADLCGFWGFVEGALAAHAATVPDYRTYTLLMVVPSAGPACVDGRDVQGGGIGRIGSGTGRAEILTPHGPAYFGTAITGEYWPASLHEFGHALGLAHANSLNCAEPGLPPDLVDCVNREYGDPFDTMGQALGDFHVLHKRQLGWLRAIGPERADVVTEPGVYRLEALEHPAGASGTKALLLPRATVPLSWLTLETRSVAGLDRLYPAEWLDGIFVHAQLAGFTLPNLQGEWQEQSTESSHFVWPTTSRRHPDARIPTGGTFTDWPWRIRVLTRDITVTPPVVEVAVEDLRVALPSPSPTMTPMACCEVPPSGPSICPVGIPPCP